MALLDHEDALVICNGYKDEEYVETALLLLAAWAARSSWWWRSPRELPAHRRGGAQARASPAHRHAREAVHARRGQVGGLGRRPLQVRPVLLGADERHRLPEGDGAAGLLRAAALPPRQPDLQHPQREERAARGGPLLRGAGAPGRAAEVPRRGRRPGRGLRRLADELHLVDELHDPGVRQRRGVRGDGGVRRARACRTPPSSPSRAAPWWRTTRCWSSTCWAPASSIRRACRRRSTRRRPRWCATCWPPTRT